MELKAIRLSGEKVIGGTMHYAYRCPKCKKKFWRMYIDYSHTYPHCKAYLILKSS